MLNVFLFILMLAFVVEAMVEYIKSMETMIRSKVATDRRAFWIQCAGLGLAVFLAFAARVDLFLALGVTFAWPWVGIALTGILFSRGANYINDFIGKLSKLLDQKYELTKRL
jgi:hypothetical protein